MLILVLPYLVVQVYAAIHLRGGWRWIALLPALPVLAVFALTLYSLYRDSNLWGLFPVLACPPAFVFVGAVLLTHRFVGFRPWAKWCGLLMTILLAAGLIAFAIGVFREQRHYINGPSLFASVAMSAGLSWGLPLAIMAVSMIALWRSERKRRASSNSGGPA